MDSIETPKTLIKSALFVDFDNIYIGLSKSDPQAAERFASDPARWLAWLERGLPYPTENKAGLPRQRSILVRRCYPNPDAGFRRFRSFFTSAAFSVIDCPSLTRTGKNSSDIYMVMDILDSLNHKTYFDEFIIFSGDSDFMPVLLRLRAHDRRTTTLAIDFMPPAFKAACDMVISEEQFIEEALGVTQEASNGNGNFARAHVSAQILKEMAARLHQAVNDAGEVAGADLPDILKDFREFRDSSNWLGYGTSLRLAEVLASCEPRLHLVRINPMMYKISAKPHAIEKPVPSRQGPPSQPVPSRALGNPPLSAPISNAAIYGKGLEKPVKAGDAERQLQVDTTENGETKPGKADVGRLREGIIVLVKELVSSSATPILLARASQVVVSKLGPQVLETQWGGAGSFKRLLQGASDMGLEITTQPEPGYIFDPRRHSHPTRERVLEPFLSTAESEQEKDEESQDNILSSDAYRIIDEPGLYNENGEDDEEEAEYSESLPSLEEFIRRVSRVTGAPDLTPQQYAQVFRGVVYELQQIALEKKVYNTYQSSKSVSEWCAERGTPISRSDIVMIFKGIIFQDGVRFGKRPGSYAEKDLAGVVLSNIKALCRRSRLELSENEHRLLDEWILGGLEEPELVEGADVQETDRIEVSND
ncbi:MAG: NYN domain-containing protein [Anaerolineaceae bacterium]|nr:NYN domain-containing protein [Anaerolineaceae bacterium]